MGTRMVSVEQGMIPRQAPLRSGTEVNARLTAFITPPPPPVRRWKLARAIHLTKMISVTKGGGNFSLRTAQAARPAPSTRRFLDQQP